MSPLGMRGSATAAVISTSELGWLPVYQMASSNVTSPERAAPGSLAERQLLTPRRPIPACLEATLSRRYVRNPLPMRHECWCALLWHHCIVENFGLVASGCLRCIKSLVGAGDQ